MLTNRLLKLARLIKCIAEVQTDKGLLITDSELAVGVEVFVTDAETGDLTPAPVGEYNTDTQVIVVNEQGIIETITEKTTEETVENEPVPQEEPVQEEETEPATEEETEEEDEKDKIIADLQAQLDAANAKIAELEAVIAEYKAKEEQTEETIEEEDKKETLNLSRTERMLNALKKK